MYLFVTWLLLCSDPCSDFSFTQDWCSSTAKTSGGRHQQQRQDWAQNESQIFNHRWTTDLSQNISKRKIYCAFHFTASVKHPATGLLLDHASTLYNQMFVDTINPICSFFPPKLWKMPLCALSWQFFFSKTNHVPSLQYLFAQSSDFTPTENFWDADCTPGLFALHQCLTSLMLNEHKSPSHDLKSRGMPFQKSKD